MTVATARVAGLASTAEATAVATTVAGLGAVAGDVAHLAALFRRMLARFAPFLLRIDAKGTHLVALSGLAAAAASRAFAGKVAGLAALVAGLVVLRRLRALTA